ncbi:Nodulation protein D 2 [Fundidesulfovibrio magnetotacticus]|uniref:Nodulation protein D 2 n=2 Tax=Fundidesulfovibrio magnetotacticus TaxID=2730080 RepID=A0A6V8LX45_9BACT|nr:Nodulation protein D 2 [Fundidesulfovibrio magnetotacticus]
MLQSNAFSFDLNILPHLLILLKERHVSRAARTIGISQPAMSRLLDKARRSFEDNLLERNSGGRSGGYVLTPLGRHLLHTLEKQLSELAAITKYKAFDPLCSDRTFCIASSEIESQLYIPVFAGRLCEASNRVRVIITQADANTLDLLDKNELDAAFWLNQVPARFSRAHLLQSKLVCLVGPNHPHAGDAFTLHEYAACQHVRTYHPAEGPNLVEHYLLPHGLERQVVAYSPHLFASAQIAASTCLVATVPLLIATTLAKATGTRVVDAPWEIPPLDLHLIWNSSMDEDPGLAWLVNGMRASSRHLQLSSADGSCINLALS